jgi:peptidoglycan/xylan/chitin deacetylase (PgdA/CDA1 family)
LKRTLTFLCMILCLSIFHVHVLASSPSIPVLLYHRLGNVQHPLYLSPKQFESQMKLLKETSYTALSIQEYENYITGATTNLPEKPILITFDDGDIDNYDLAFPILKRYGYKATFFIPTDFLDQPGRITSSQC